MIIEWYMFTFICKWIKRFEIKWKSRITKLNRILHVKFEYFSNINEIIPLYYMNELLIKNYSKHENSKKAKNIDLF